MGRYFHPANLLTNAGRRLIGENFAQLTSQLANGEILIGSYGKIMWEICPVLDSQSEYDEFEGQYRRGFLLSASYYAVNIQHYSKNID
jgi:hypothetical protein